MFIGYFGAGLVAEKFVPVVNLGVYLDAFQLLDLIWPDHSIFLGDMKNVFDPKARPETPPVTVAGPVNAMWLLATWIYHADKKYE